MRIIERTLKRAGLLVPDTEPEQARAFRQLAQEAPLCASDIIERVFAQAAKCWVDGNNSGNSNELQAGEAGMRLLRREAEAALAVIGPVTVNYPGLYPSFIVGGYSEYSVLNAVKAIVRKEAA